MIWSARRIDAIVSDCSTEEAASAAIRLLCGEASDYPGSREACVQLYDLRRATADEWKSHLDGEWPWDDKYGPL